MHGGFHSKVIILELQHKKSFPIFEKFSRFYLFQWFLAVSIFWQYLLLFGMYCTVLFIFNFFLCSLDKSSVNISIYFYFFRRSTRYETQIKMWKNIGLVQDKRWDTIHERFHCEQQLKEVNVFKYCVQMNS